MQLRRARADDADGIAAILVDLGWFPSLPDAPADAAAHVLARIPDAEDLTRHMVVATDSAGTVAGYVHWTVTHPVFLDGPSLYLTELFVRADLRGAGVGARLLAEVHEHARTVDATRVELLQHRDREAYRRGFYLGAGYEEVEGLAVLRRPGRLPSA